MVKGTKKSTKKGTSKTKTKKTNDNKLLVWAVVLVALLIVLAISLTYAYFSRNVTQIGEDPNTTVTTGKLDVNFVTSKYISNTKAGLIDDEVAYLEADRSLFSVSRSELNTVEKVYYTISLVDIEITDNLKESKYMRWSLYETQDIDSKTEPLAEGDFTGVEDNSLSLYDTKIAMPKNITHEFTLLVWLSNDDDVNQTALLNGNLKAKVQVTAVNV